MKIHLSFFRFVSLSLISVLFVSTLSVSNTFAQSGRQKPTGTDQKKNSRDQKKEEEKKEEAPPKDVINTPKDGDVVTVATNIVNVDVVVYHKKTGQIVTGLKKENFVIYDDKEQQPITNFSTPDAPITVAVVVEFSKLGQRLGLASSVGFDNGTMEVIRPVATFLTQFIKPPNDYASVVAYDMRPTPLTDFTNDPRRLQQVIYLLLRNNPAFSETNLFDALKFTLLGGKGDAVVLEDSKEEYAEYGGLKDIQGRRKAILLVASGLDTFSKINYDKARKIVQSSGVPIYIIGTGELFFKKYEPYLPATSGIGGSINPGRMDFYQAKNALKTFANESGGDYVPVTFEGEIPAALQKFNALMRNQYSIAFVPKEDRKDGKSHKLVVKVDVDGDGTTDEKNYIIQHREVYLIPKPEDIKK